MMVMQKLGRPIRIGTRTSPLAVAQASEVALRLAAPLVHVRRLINRAVNMA